MFSETPWSKYSMPARHALRSRAGELSRRKIRPLKVTDLPLDVLGVTFDHFQEPAVKGSRRAVEWSEYDSLGGVGRGRTVRNARLVCRRFCELTSPLMFPILRLWVSQASLDLADEISRVPRIAAGVRGILMSLACWPKYMADDIRLFTRYSLRSLHGHNLRPSPPSSPSLPALQLMSDWGPEDDPEKEKLLSGGRERLILEGQNRFGRLQREQHQLLYNGSFIRTLSLAVARMGKLGCFFFVQTSDGENMRFFYRDDPHLSVTYTDARCSPLCKPMAWNIVEAWAPGPVELPCARILWELPIALNNAGAPPTNLTLDTLPYLSHNFSAFCPSSHKPQTQHTISATWDALSAACEKLTVPEFRPSPNREQFHDDDRTPLDNYLGSVLSRCGPNLRHLYLDFAPSGLDAQLLRNRHRRLFYHAGALVAALPELPRLHTLGIEGLELEQADLEALCRKAGAEGGLCGPAVSNVRLRTGLWADAVDMLRRKFARETHSRPRRHLSLYALRGGEFGNGEGEQEDDDAPESEPGSHINPGEMMGDAPARAQDNGLCGAVLGHESAEGGAPHGCDDQHWTRRREWPPPPD